MAGTAITNIYPNVFPCVLLYLNKKTETLGYQDADIPETIAMWKSSEPRATTGCYIWLLATDSGYSRMKCLRKGGFCFLIFYFQGLFYVYRC